jgi:hypothetical protein
VAILTATYQLSVPVKRATEKLLDSRRRESAIDPFVEVIGVEAIADPVVSQFRDWNTPRDQECFYHVDHALDSAHD